MCDSLLAADAVAAADVAAPAADCGVVSYDTASSDAASRDLESAGVVSCGVVSSGAAAYEVVSAGVVPYDAVPSGAGLRDVESAGAVSSDAAPREVVSAAVVSRDVAPAGAVARCDAAALCDRGSTSLTIVLLAPLLSVLMFAGLQAALWNHARADARLVARDIAALVARDGMTLEQASTAAYAALAASDLDEARVEVSSADGSVTVSIRGQAPGILRGTTRAVHVTARLPLEGWVPL